MGIPVRSGLGAQGVRVLLLLALLIGLVAMHGLAGGHHTPATAAEHAVAAAEAHGSATADHHAADARDAGPGAVDTVGNPAVDTVSPWSARPTAAPATPSCDQDCPVSLTTLCVAVLAAAAVVTAAVRVLRCRRAVTVASGRVAGSPRAARPGLPPPDPVRELCVSRT